MISENIETIKSELPSGVSLVAVSKFHPSDYIREAYACGQRIFGESRPQELAAKVAELSVDCPGIEWHFIGHLQTNKLRMVLPHASLVESVDSVHLLDEINKWGKSESRVVNVLLELHVAEEESKQGFFEEEMLDLMFRYSDGAWPNVRVRGMMAMATNTDDESVIAADFERARIQMDYIREIFPELDDFTELSMGMSSDWRIALRYGSTSVRIGTAVFGSRA